MTDPAGSRVFFHVGVPKTGTTYLQCLLWQNRQELRRRGLTYPGKRPEDQFLAAMDVQGATVEEVGDPHLPYAWPRLVAAIRAARGTVLVSHELFAPMEPDRIEQVLDAVRDRELHVVCTVRDLGRQLPAVWQEDLKNRQSLSFAEFLDAVRAPEDGHWLGGLFWRMQDVPEVLRRWAGTVAPQRVHVVTVPPRGSAPELLWQRFAGLLGVDVEGIDATPEAPNSSLGPAEAQFLRRLNRSLPEDVPWWLYERTVRRQVIDVLANRPSGTRLTVPADQLPWVREQAKRMVGELTEAGYDVVGDLSELTPDDVASAPDPDQVTDAEILDVALEATNAIVARYGAAVTEAQQRSRSVRQRIRDLGERNPAVQRVLGFYRTLRHPARRRPR
jgi:hypothetical protein